MLGVEDHQVQVDLVTAVPVLSPQGVGPGVLQLGLEDLEDGGGSSLVLLALHLELLVAHNLLPVLPPAEGWRRLKIFQSENVLMRKYLSEDNCYLSLDVDPPDSHPVYLH